jgi:hypothetical protein
MCACPQIANPQIFMTNLQIADPQTSTKYCKTLSQNSPKICKEKKYGFTDLSKFEIRKKAWAVKSSKRKSTNHKKYWLCISQYCTVSYLRMFRKAIKLFKFANLRIRDLRNLFADCTHLLNTQR